MKFEIEAMQNRHLDEIVQIENENFTNCWSRNAFEEELQKGESCIYRVILLEKRVVAYGGMWHILDQGHLTNIAVKKDLQGQSIGKILLDSLTDRAIELEIASLTLEVNISNIRAQRLYFTAGFVASGIRKGYYTETNEDAIIMWKYL